MKRFLLMPFIILLTSCGYTSSGIKQSHDADTLVAKTAALKSTDEELTPDLNQQRLQYIAGYNKPQSLEHLIKGKNDERIKLFTKYYSLNDSSIIVPGIYCLEDTTKSFQTHNFAEDVLIVSNGDTILKKTITKKYFLDNLPEHLKEYGVIMHPEFEGYDIENDIFWFSFSISIPITEVGERRLLSITRNGQITTSSEE